MQIHILHKEDCNTSCILFFNGWGMDKQAISHLKNSRHDIYEIHDYTELDSIAALSLNSYSNIYVIAWSMGVWAAAQVLAKSPISITKAIAINGTEQPMHSELGIPENVFEGTISYWNDITKKKFNARMCGTPKLLESCGEYMSARTTDEQKNELEQIRQTLINKKSDTITWDCAIIGEEDYIFTAKNQKNYWHSKTKCITLPIFHFPFNTFVSWDEIILLSDE